MDYSEALALVKDVFAPRKLNYIEELVLRGSWEDKSYREMAQETGYEEGYLKDTGSRLWRDLSEKLGYPVTKKRVTFILPGLVQNPEILPKPAASLPSQAIATDFPGASLPFGSSLYIERPPVEALAIATLQQPGGLVRIKAPWRMGKTSLINHLLGRIRQLEQQTVLIDIRQADATALTNLDAFLRWFCWMISHQLNLECHLDDAWFAAAGSKINCTVYLQEQVLAKLETPVVVAIDTVHYLMEYPSIAHNFFSMLRSWYEQSRVHPQWQKLRLILAHIAELDLPLQAHQSPFNVGLLVELPGLSCDQSYKLVESYAVQGGRMQKPASFQVLFDLVGGHPYLLQMACYWLQSGQLSLPQLIHTAATNQGIYREYLRQLWLALQGDADLISAFHTVLMTRDPVRLNRKQADELAGMGLVKLVDHRVQLQCELYRPYFSSLLDLECG